MSPGWEQKWKNSLIEGRCVLGNLEKLGSVALALGCREAWKRWS